MAGFLRAGPLWAGVFKLSIAAAVAAGIWMLRRYRRILELSLALAAGMLLLTAYHVFGVVALGG